MFYKLSGKCQHAGRMTAKNYSKKHQNIGINTSKCYTKQSYYRGRSAVAFGVV